MADSHIPAVEFEFKSPRQDRSFAAFSDFILDPLNPPPAHGEPCREYDISLDELLFEMLESLFYQNLVPVDGITCPTDLFLTLLWLKDDGSAVAASQATHACAILQYWAYTTVVHTLRLRLTNIPKYCEHTIDPSMGSPFIVDGYDDLAENVIKYVIINTVTF